MGLGGGDGEGRGDGDVGGDGGGDGSLSLSVAIHVVEVFVDPARSCARKWLFVARFFDGMLSLAMLYISVMSVSSLMLPLVSLS